MSAPVLDPRALPAQALARIAQTVHDAYDIELPVIPGWNDRPCPAHDELAASCLRCGVRPRRHQRVGITWLYLTARAGLFDSTGLGKTVQAAALLALLRASGELSADHRALIVSRAAVIPQWRAQLARMVPDLPVTCVTGDARARARAISGTWEVALCGPEMVTNRRSRAVDLLLEFDFGTVICDDIAALGHVNKTSKTIRQLTDRARRVVVATATPLDKRLTQLYDTGRVLGWPAVLGSEEEFVHRYVRTEQVWYTPKLKPVRCKFCHGILLADHRNKAWVSPRNKLPPQWPLGTAGPCPAKPGTRHFPLSRVTPGAKFTVVERGVNPDHLAELRAKTDPLVLRRTAADCDDVAMPAAVISHVPVELGAGQRQRYEELRRGVLTRLDERGRPVSKQEAEAVFLRARQVVSGLANLDNGKTGESVKLERVTDQLTGDLAGEPVVVYCYFRPTLADLAGRLDKEGIASVRIWGEQHASEQEHAIAAFNSGASNVMLVTDAGGMGLDLQKSRRLIVADIPVSAGRFRQLLGRIQRDGSRHQTCYAEVMVSDTPIDLALAASVGAELDMFDAVMNAEGTDSEIPWPDAVSLLKAVTG
jgi:hypothetical protein